MADKYVQRMFGQVIESAANTLTYSQIQTGIQTFSKKAFLVHRVEWWTGDDNLLGDDDDYIQMALMVSNKPTGISRSDPAVIDMFELHLVANGAPATAEILQIPYVHDFSTLPGGGLLIPGYPIFVAVEGVSLASAVTVSMLVFFTIIDLKTEEYLELVEATRMLE